MSLSLDRVHQYKKDEATGRMVLIKSNPYVKMVREGDTPVIVQGGRFYTEGGDSIAKRDVPKWVWKGLSLRTPEGLKSIGITDLADLQARQPAPVEAAQIMGDDTLPPKLSDVLMSLDHNEESHWTKAGLPDLNAVKERMGKYVSRTTVSEAISDFCRNQ